MKWPWLSRLKKKRPSYVQLGLRNEADLVRSLAERASEDHIQRYYEAYARNLEEAARCR